MNRPPPTIPVARDLDDVNNILRDIGLYLKQLSLIPGLVIPPATVFSGRLAIDNVAIASGDPATPVSVSNLARQALIGEAWDYEWTLDIENSVADDVYTFNVFPEVGVFTGRYTVTGINGVPGTWDGLVNILQASCGTPTPASTHAPGNTGAVGGITTVIVRARGIQSVADSFVRVGVRASTSAGTASGTATVKAGSQLISRNIT